MFQHVQYMVCGESLGMGNVCGSCDMMCGSCDMMCASCDMTCKLVCVFHVESLCVHVCVGGEGVHGSCNLQVPGVWIM